MRSIIFSVACLMLIVIPAQAAQQMSDQDLASINISHPFIISFSSGRLRGNFVNDFEIGLGGAKVGLGLGAIEGNSFIAIKAIAMYKWEEPFGDQFDMEDLIDQVDFPNKKWYYGVEGVLSNSGYRIALQSYRIYDPDDDDSDETFYGASIGLGF